MNRNRKIGGVSLRTIYLVIVIITIIISGLMFYQTLKMGHEVEYGKKKGDFKVDGKYTFEVGGPSKDFKQIAGVPDSYVLADDIDYPYGNKLPLWIIGFLY